MAIILKSRKILNHTKEMLNNNTNKKDVIKFLMNNYNSIESWELANEYVEVAQTEMIEERKGRHKELENTATRKYKFFVKDRLNKLIKEHNKKYEI